MGRRYLLTTASNGSANGLQVISDRLADNFSILPGHHGTGDNGGDDDSEDDDDGGGGGGGGGGVGGDEVEEDEGGGGIMAKSFAMFECREEERSHSRCARAVGGSASPLFFSLCVIQCLSTTPKTYT